MNTNPTVDAVQLNETAAADPDRDLVDVLAEVYAQRLRNREDPAIREYSEMFPEQAGEIWDAFPAVAWLEGALSPLGAAFTSESQATMAAGAGDISVGISPPRTGTPDSIGDFRIVREIGRGGMGVVYEAVQQSLGRTVALKVLPPSINLSESQIGRFHREAQSAGRLHHTNIVPVFGVGEHDGMHYYVMQCIQGQGLDSILNSFHVVEGAFVSTNQTTEGNTGPSNTAVNEKSKSGSTTEQTINVGRRRIEIQTYETTRYWQSVAEIGRQVTDDALQHAHDQNTLHRDIKPANLLLDVHDTVWITDFGLAKSLEQDAFNITQTGEVLGTPRYMSPEQLRGKAEKRSDLYSLGLTLYEMLSLRPAFDAQDRASLLKQVMYEQPPPLDKVNPRIPQDLVTVVHKAIAKEPERRYQTAGLLRDDLERFIEGRPILARRTSNLMRLWLWSKRNPVIAGLSAATFLLILLSAVIGWKGYADTRRALRKVDVQLDQTRKERGRAEDNLNLALQAFDEVFQQIGGDASLDAGGGKLALSRDMANMMESLLIFYTHFIERNADRKGLELEEIRAHTRMGQLYLRLGQFPEARASLENALILYDELPEEKRPDLFTRDQARLLRRIGTTYMTWFETSQARDLFGQAKLILGRALENDSENVELLFEFANVCQEFAMLAPPKGMHEAAPSAEEHELPSKPAAAGGTHIPPFKEDALTAQSIFRRLIQESPKHPEYKRSLARSLRNMAEPHLAFWSTRQDTERSLKEAMDLLAQLKDAHPENPDYTYEWVVACNTIRRWLQILQYQHPKTFAKWQTRFTDVHPAIEDLVNRYPAVPAYRAALAVNHNLDGRNNAAAGKTDVAEAHFRQSVQLNSVLLRYDPSTSHWESYTRSATLWLQMLMGQGRRNDAAEAKEEIIRVYEETLKTGRFGSQQWRMLELQLDSLVSLLDAMGRGDEALIHQLRAEEIRDEWGFVPLDQLRPELEN